MAERATTIGELRASGWKSRPVKEEIRANAVEKIRVGEPLFAGVLGYESFWLGAEGWVAVCSNLIPRWSAELFNLVADKRDMDAALALYMKMTPLLWWVGGPRYVSGTKAAFEMMGMPMGPPRAPRLPLPEAQRPALREVLRQMGVLAEEKVRARA